MLAPIVLVTEPRLKVAVLGVPGLSPLPTQPEVDPFNFVTRATQPVLMLSGEYDMVHPLETSARPMFRLWNAPPDRKRHVVVDGAHNVPYPTMMRETVAWLDRFLGPVGRSGSASEYPNASEGWVGSAVLDEVEGSR